MPTSQFLLPDLGEGLEDAEVVRWLVAEDEQVGLNQPLVEVDTAKALVEIPSPFAGKVKTLHASSGEVVKVGAPLVTFEVEQDDASPPPQRKAVLVGYGVDEATGVKRRRRLSPGASAPQAPTAPPAQQTTGSAGTAGRASAAPPVRKLAAELGVDIDKVSGSGPGGRITREDVIAASSIDAERIDVKGVRRLVAEKMSKSVAQIPHVTTYLSVDATELMAVREELKAKGNNLTPLAVIAKAWVRTCLVHRKLNSSWDPEAEQIVLHGTVHLGIAADTERGLVVPVIQDAQSLSIAQLGQQISELSDLAREGRASVEHLTGSTVTISNVGSFGAEYGTPIINHPEASILAVGVIEPRVVVRSGGIVVRPMCTMSLSFDHRILDGAEAGRALLHLRQVLQDAEQLRAS